MTSNAMNNRWCRWALMLGAHCLLLVAAPRCEAQNLVPNPSFELRDSCLEVNTAYTENTGPLGWFSGGGTGDYFMSCIPYGGFNGVPLSAWAFQSAQDGDCYVGVITFQQSQGVREYFMIQLTETLVPGQTYYASFYANAAWNGVNTFPQHYLASSHIGMLFTTQPRPWWYGDPWPTGVNEAHVFHPWIIADTVDWTLVSGSFVADSAYQYLMVGNHFDNANTDTLHFATFAWTPKAYTLIDNVCVSPNPKGCPQVLGLFEPELDAVVLFPNPASAEIGLSGLPQGSSLTVHDALGRLVWHEQQLGGAWRRDVQEWARGAYLLRLEQQGRSRSFKIVLTE